MQQLDLDRVAEEILKDPDTRNSSLKIGVISGILAFCISFVVFYYTESDPWVVMGKVVLTALFGFFVGFFGMLFAITKPWETGNGSGEGEGEAHRGDDAAGGEGGHEDKAEASS